MSFAAEVRDELYESVDKARHCNIAELSGIIIFGCVLKNEGRDTVLLPEKGSERFKNKYLTLVNKVLKLNEWEAVKNEDALNVLRTMKLYSKDLKPGSAFDTANGIIIQQSCCKKAYLRGAFLAAGTVTDPNKAYDLEIAAKTEKQALQLAETFNYFDVNAKIVKRKNHFVVYLKEGAKVVDALNIVGAHKSLMNLENVRIVKEVRSDINRKVNCETANISKTVNASVKQIEDIEYISKTIGLSNLPETLAEMATVRLEHSDVPLKELGEYLDKPIGKSGVNHRLRRISEIADKLRMQEE